MSAPTDVEISRALNAVSTTLRDQEPERFDAGRVNEIALGALAHEPKLTAAATGATSGELRRSEDGCVIAVIHRTDGEWEVERRVQAGNSSWALPQPEHDKQQTQSESSPEREDE